MAGSLAAVGAALCVGLLLESAGAHPLDPALLDLRELPGGQVTVLWRVPTWAPTGAPLRPVLPERCIAGAPPVISESGQGLTSRWRVDCGPLGLVGAPIGIEGLHERKTEALLRIRLATGRLIQAVVRGDQPTLTIPAARGGLVVARDYVRLGLDHILWGLDHLLFVLGLVLLVRGRRPLVWIITAFTVGHSVTLSLAVLGIVRMASAPVEVLIAVSIVAVAVELTRAQPVRAGWMMRAPWAVTFGFGLLHGLGFAGALAQAGLPADEIPLALVGFNLGIELGQLGFVGAVVALRAALGRLHVRWPAAAARIPAYAIGSLAAFWVIDRVWGMLF